MRPKKVVVLVMANEDDLSVRSYLLETHGYRVYAFETPTAALGYIERTAPWQIDAVAADMLLPVFDGREFAARVKRVQPQLKVLLFSDAVAHQEHNTQADAFLGRGENTSIALLHYLKQLCSRRRGPKRASVRARETGQTKATAA